MDGPAPEPFYLPPFFSAFCVLAAMTMVVAPIVWVRRCYSARPPAHDLGREVFILQFRLLAAVLFLSFILNLVRLAVTGGSVHLSFYNLLPELLLLGFMGWRYLKHTQDTKGAPGTRLLTEAGRILRVFALCLLGWAVTFAVGLIVLQVSLPVTHDPEASMVAAGFAAGTSWVLAVTVAYYYRRPALESLPEQAKRYKSYDLLWPVMLAYILLLAPMLMQEIGNSDKFHEMMFSKRPPRKI
ncbi:MAG: hypothetical protein H6858_05400 [Rhodospirillales bacterium]|nr:hypothetical protein [Rhodospirillales bacterium]